jgi:peptide/nickel transport system substrate-binding protein
MLKNKKIYRLHRLGLVSVAVAMMGTTALAQNVTQVPRERTLVMTPWGDRTGPFSNVENFNPYLISVDQERNIGHMTYNEALFYTNMNTGELVPWQALSYENSDDFMQATINLRDGVTWADGTPFTSADVKFTLEMLRDAGPEIQGSAGHKEWIKSVEAPDPLTVVISFNKPAPRFVANEIALSHDDLYPILPRHIWEGEDLATFTNYDPARGLPMGTGAYRLVSTGANQMIFDRRDDWWGAATGFTDLPAPERIILTPHSGDDSMGQMLIADQVDAGRQIQKGTFEAASSLNPNLRSWNAEGPAWGAPDACTYTLQFNNGREPWNNADLHWAINHALDRGRLSLIAYEGGMPPAVMAFSGYMTDVWLQPDGVLQATLDEWNIDNPSQELVDQRMAAAGYERNGDGIWAKDGAPLDILLRAPEFIQPLLAPMAQQLRDAGFNAREGAFDDSWRTDMLNGTFDSMIFVHCGSISEPLDTLQHYHSKFGRPEGQPVPYLPAGTRYSNPEYDAIIDRMLAIEPSTDPESDYMKDAVAALNVLQADLPEINMLEELHVITFNQTYWTGWPSAENPYAAPYPPFDSFNLIVHGLQAAK